MRNILKARWAIFAVWLVATVLLTVFQPDFNAVLRHKGQQALASDSAVVAADAMLARLEGTTGSSDILVFYDKDKLSDEDMKQIETGMQAVRGAAAELGIGNIVDPFATPDAKSSLLSGDGTTLLVSFQLNKGNREVSDIQKAIEAKLSGVQAEHYLTGQDFISDDYLKASLAGVEKSAALTVLFILVVLILMFRSVVTPVASLLSVGFSYLCSMGIAAQLIVRAGFPVTSLTQMLLILVLFGIGTDYNILLFNRFKEELARGASTDDAIVNTYKTAGKTIAYSVLTVLIAFLSLVFAQSPIYQSGVVVVIGAAVLLLEIVTLTPFVMKVFGAKLFWPSRRATGHKESRLWGRITAACVRHPLISIAAVALIIVPTIFFHQQKLSFDTIGELGDSYPSSKAFHIVADHFGRGQAMPLNVVIQSGSALDNNESMAVIDDLTARLRSIPGVDKVSSVTQPQGKPIDNFYIGTNMKDVTGGITQTKDGVDQIASGLKQAQDKLGSADFSRVGELVDGTAQFETGVSALADGLKQLQAGIGNASDAQSIRGGIAAIETNLAKMSAGVRQLSSGYKQMQAGYKTMGTSYQGAAQALLGVKGGLAQMQGMIAALGSSYAGAATDPSYLGLKQTVDTLLQSLSAVTPQGIATLNQNYDALTAGFGKANASLDQMAGGLTQMTAGLKKLESGLGQTAGGIGTVASNMGKVSDGLGQMKSGLAELQTGLDGFSAFGTGLKQLNDGLKQISDGLDKTNGYLTQLNGSKTFFLPKEALESADFKKALDAYLSDDRTSAKLVVVLKDDPYSPQALAAVKQIKAAVAAGLQGTTLSGATFGVSGPSASTSEMNDVLSRDLNRMILIVLAGVFVVLLFVTRSFWTPVFITVALVGAYFASMFVVNTIFLTWLGYAGISSFVPFFSFIVVAALGVDYSIFLMMRYKEYPDLPPREAIVMASRHVGGVVMSAAVILGGTFATLMPAGILLLIELAVAVIVGLFVLCFVLLPVFLPATIALPGMLSSSFGKKSVAPEQ